jgi:hypothetical protein
VDDEQGEGVAEVRRRRVGEQLLDERLEPTGIGDVRLRLLPLGGRPRHTVGLGWQRDERVGHRRNAIA